MLERKIDITLILIAAIGFAGGVIFSILGSSNINEARVFQREEGKPGVIRFYKPGFDSILVEDSKNQKYIALETYLNKIPDIADRKVERAEIEKLVEWYK